MSKNQYLTIARELHQRIRRGQYKVGTALPPRVLLAEEFRVARATMDRCFEHLIQRGIVEARQGAGSFVREVAKCKRQVAFLGARVDLWNLPEDFQWQYFSYDMLAKRSERAVLRKFDGVIWMYPTAEIMEHWLGELPQSVSQVLVNRIYPGYPCVTTDHRGAYYSLTLERLRRFPQARVVFLHAEQNTLPSRYRESGFVDACREEQRFYERLVMPEKFPDKLELLRHALAGVDEAAPLLIVSDSRLHTGAVMVWAREGGRKWGVDTFYNDIDNDYPEEVWGVMVTSFLQDERHLILMAMDKLNALLEGEGDPEEHILEFPRLRPGLT